jgi:transcriptional regulator with XRE-family HTH domain
MQGTPRISLREGVLYQLRKQAGISRDEWARRVGLSSSAAWRLEAGLASPSAETIARLLVMTGKRFEDLFEVEVAD